MKKEGIPGHPEVAKRLLQARVGAGFTQSQLADKVSALLDTIVSRSLISRTEKAERDAESRLVWAVAQATGESFDWLMEPLNKLRDLDRAIPGYLNSAVELPGVPADNLNHDTTSCVDCLIDQNHLVTAEWLTPGGELPGQTRIVIDLTEAALTFAEAV